MLLEAEQKRLREEYLLKLKLQREEQERERVERAEQERLKRVSFALLLVDWLLSF